MLMPASTASLSIAAISSAVNVVLAAAARFSSSCADAADAPISADVTRGVAQHPRDRHLRERLPARGGDLVQRPDVRQRLLAELVLRQRPVPRGPRACPGCRPGTWWSAAPWASGENAMQPTPSSLEDVEQPALDPAVEHRVRRLVDQQRRAERCGGSGRPPLVRSGE